MSDTFRTPPPRAPVALFYNWSLPYLPCWCIAGHFVRRAQVPSVSLSRMPQSCCILPWLTILRPFQILNDLLLKFCIMVSAVHRLKG